MGEIKPTAERLSAEVLRLRGPLEQIAEGRACPADLATKTLGW